MSNTPNFIIAGAAKSGTTSLANYLNHHPDVCMSPLKEPKFFTSELLKHEYCGPGDHAVFAETIKTFSDYKKLFSHCQTNTLTGEASADILYYSHHTAPLMLDLIGPDLKIIIILRNPIERAFSAYSHLVRDGRETLSFRDALEAETARIQSGWEFIWHYVNAGFYCKQIRHLKRYFANVRIYLYDDLVASPRELLSDIISFLTLSQNTACTSRFSRFNMSGTPRSRQLHKILATDNLLKSLARPFFSQSARTYIRENLLAINLKKTSIDKDSRSILIKTFASEVRDLSVLLDRDLSHWLS